MNKPSLGGLIGLYRTGDLAPSGYIPLIDLLLDELDRECADHAVIRMGRDELKAENDELKARIRELEED